MWMGHKTIIESHPMAWCGEWQNESNVWEIKTLIIFQWLTFRHIRTCLFPAVTLFVKITYVFEHLWVSKENQTQFCLVKWKRKEHTRHQHVSHKRSSYLKRCLPNPTLWTPAVKLKNQIIMKQILGNYELVKSWPVRRLHATLPPPAALLPTSATRKHVNQTINMNIGYIG